MINDEEKLRRDVVKHPELKEYRKGGTRQNNVLPVWAVFSYFEMGTMVMIYSYLRGDLRKEVLDYTYSQSNYKKEVTKQMYFQIIQIFIHDYIPAVKFCKTNFLNLPVMQV